MPEQPFLYAHDGAWIPVKDGNNTARSIFDRHYSRYFYKDGRKPKLFVGPGHKMVLLTQNCRALFIWRKFYSRAKQEGVNCAVFRNERSGYVSSELIREADAIADAKWPHQRHYTYVKADAVLSRNPGYCFIRAGWQRCGMTKSGLLIFERPAPLESRPE